MKKPAKKPVRTAKTGSAFRTCGVCKTKPACKAARACKAKGKY